MRFLSLFRLELATTWRPLVLFAALSGLSNASILATINGAAAATGRDGLGSPLVILLLSIIIYSITQKALMVRAATLAETTVNGMRTQFIESLRSADLKDVETLNQSAVYAAISGEMQVLSDGALNLIIVGQALVLLLVTMAYLAFLSFIALLLAVVFIGVAAAIHLSRADQLRAQLRSAFQLETRMLQGFTDFVQGFKEVKQNIARSAELSSSLRNSISKSPILGLSSRRVRSSSQRAPSPGRRMVHGVPP